MALPRSIVLTSLAMIAFAANSVLCRFALKDTAIDPASFTAIRLLAGALMLWLIVRMRSGVRSGTGTGSWLSAAALFAYAAAFSFAYVGLSTGVGALVLFGAVQVTMIAHGLWAGERLRILQVAGVLLAFAGLVGLLLPGQSAPPLPAALLMLVAGAAWGVYSLRGRGAGDPVRVTADNFLRTLPMALILVVAMHAISADPVGIGYAVASGALTSGIGYMIWYAVLPSLRATTAGVVQLSVPPLAALGGVVFLVEQPSLRLLLATVTVLGGIALVIVQRAPSESGLGKT